MNSSPLQAPGKRLTRLGIAGLQVLVLTLALAVAGRAQGLGWEGETGVFVTPLAYTASAESQKIHVVTAYHFLGAGSVIGNFHEASIEVGIGKRIEIGYTHEFHTFGDNAALSPLWQNGFEIFNGKVNVVPENFGKHDWIPAISTGFMMRVNVRNVGDYQPVNPMMNGKNNGDVYMVASKTVPTKLLPILLSAGVRGTNAELWGMGGNAPNWQAEAFGSIGFVVKGPSGTTIILATEAAQQPHHPNHYTADDPLPLSIPTTLVYAARFLPSQKYKLNFDFGIAQIAGQVAPDVDLKARHQVGVQVSYGF